jgi:hypothetical protein
MTSARVAAAAAAASMADADPALARISVPAWPGACRRSLSDLRVPIHRRAADLVNTARGPV